MALVAVLLPLGPILARFYPPDLPPQDYSWMGGQWVSQLLVHLFTLSLLVRRRFSFALLCVGTAMMLVHVVTYSADIGAFLAMNQRTDPWMPANMPYVLYAFAAYETGRKRQVAGWVLVGVVLLTALRLWTNPDGETMSNAFWITAFPPVLGAWIAARRKLVAALRDRADRAEREQELLAEQARADERAKLAAEMHDVVTHRVSLMVLQAGALGVTAQDEPTRTAAEELRAGGCQALDELRDFIGVLRSGGDDSPDESERSALPDLSGLITETEAVGIPVRLTEQGRTAGVAPLVSRTAYRVVQEALTNVHKHAADSEVDVGVVYDGERVLLTVRNTPPTSAHELAASGSGAGLQGLEQRVELVGGTLRAGPLPDGGFEVSAILPAYVPTIDAD